MTTLSLRRLWVLYKRTAIAHGTGGSKRNLALVQIAFCSGARAALKVLDHRICRGANNSDLLALRYDNWKITFMKQQCLGTCEVWANPFTVL
jgi:hypothetical protein